MGDSFGYVFSFFFLLMIPSSTQGESNHRLSKECRTLNLEMARYSIWPLHHLGYYHYLVIGRSTLFLISPPLLLFPHVTAEVPLTLKWDGSTCRNLILNRCSLTLEQLYNVHPYVCIMVLIY
jgi:hypothetical protein